MTKSLEEMSGETNAGTSPKLVLNEIRINGNEGKFLFKDVLGGRKPSTKKDGKERYEEKEIGDSIELVFLKIRRKMSQYKKGGNSLNTNEHNHKGDFVTLFGAEGGVKRGVASDLREIHQGLRTVQVVYVLYKGELVRLIVKGSSLGSDAKPEDRMDFYTYISSFKKDGREDHFYNYTTKLVATVEEGEQGTYYSMTFSEGDKLNEKDMVDVEEKMTIAFKYAEALDTYVLSKKEETKKGEVDTIEYDNTDNEPEGKTGEAGKNAEDINPDDIPF